MDGALQYGCPQVSEDGRVPPSGPRHPRREAYPQRQGLCQQIGLPKNAVEFQMLNGIRRDLQESLAAEGYPVRVYVPYGTQWYPYFVRRLAERPANVWFFLSNFFRS